MKRPISYKPKYSLSLYYLKKIMSKKELDELLKKYVKAKVENWHNYGLSKVRKNS